MFGVPSNDELVQLVKDLFSAVSQVVEPCFLPVSRPSGPISVRFQDTVRINEARFLEAVLPEEAGATSAAHVVQNYRRNGVTMPKNN